jgi:hypothetical protein
VVVTGDVRATQLLRDQVPGRVGELLQVVDGEYGSLDAALAKAAPLLDLLEARDTTAMLAAFGRELGQADRAANGPAATLQALASSQVSTLLLQPGAVTGDAWFGPSPAQIALDPQNCMRWVSPPQPERPWSTSPSGPPPPAARARACWPTSSPTGAGPQGGSGRCCGTPGRSAIAEPATLATRQDCVWS